MDPRAILQTPPRPVDARWEPLLRPKRIGRSGVALGLGFSALVLLVLSQALQFGPKPELVQGLFLALAAVDGVLAVSLYILLGRTLDSLGELIMHGEEVLATVEHDEIVAMRTRARVLEYTFDYAGRRVRARTEIDPKLHLEETEEEGARRIRILVDPNDPGRTLPILRGRP